MARPLWCRHKECDGKEPYISEAGFRPAVCPACQKVAHWATVPDATPARVKYAKEPRPKFDLTENDRKLLKSLRILQE